MQTSPGVEGLGKNRPGSARCTGQFYGPVQIVSPNVNSRYDYVYKFLKAHIQSSRLYLDRHFPQYAQTHRIFQASIRRDSECKLPNDYLRLEWKSSTLSGCFLLYFPSLNISTVVFVKRTLLQEFLALGLPGSK